MEKNYRSGYFYLNTLLNKLLLGKHSPATITALTKVIVGKSKADFVLINGKAVVYEIKSDLDTLDRLETQLHDYYKAFNHICVATTKKNFDRLFRKMQDTPVGLLVLTDSTTISKKLAKKAEPNSAQLDHRSPFQVLRKNEFENIVLTYYKHLPNTAPVFYYDSCFEMFSGIPIFDAYSAALKEIKKRNIAKSGIIRKVPKELRALFYFLIKATRSRTPE